MDAQNLTPQQNQVSNIQLALKADWETYYQQLNDLAAGYQVSGSLKLLHSCDELLNQGKDLAQTEEVERLMLGGGYRSQRGKALSV